MSNATWRVFGLRREPFQWCGGSCSRGTQGPGHRGTEKTGLWGWQLEAIRRDADDREGVTIGGKDPSGAEESNGTQETRWCLITMHEGGIFHG